jgi:hypothetical protein
VAEHLPAGKSGDLWPIRVDYRGFTMTLLDDKKVVAAGEEAKRQARNVRLLGANMEMEADGNVASASGDFARLPVGSRELMKPISEQTLQALELVAVPLPQGVMHPLLSWKVQRTILMGSTLLGVPAQANIQYTYLGTRALNKREIAFLNITGKVRGLRGAGLNVAGTIDGGSQVALDTGEVLSATMNFKADMDVDLKRDKAKLFGNLTVRVRRDPPASPSPPAPKRN